MENKDKAAIIIAVVKQKVELATNDYINAKADLAKAELGDQLWKEEEEKQGGLGWSQSPYRVDPARKRVAKTLEEKVARDEVLAYAIEVFLNKIPS
jgi:hypothetical protein